MLTALHSLIDDRNDITQAKQLKQFAEQYYAGAPMDELLARSVDDVYGATVSCWHFIQQRQPCVPKIRVFNPDYENHGWQSMHTVIEIVFEDMPFLIDSIRMQLNVHKMSIHSIHCCVIEAQRQQDYQLDLSHNLAKKSAQSNPEAIIYIEIDHHSDRNILNSLSHDLHKVLMEVSSCVADFPAIMDCAKATVKSLTAAAKKSNKDGYEEATAFVKWLNANHFTFLAYDEFNLKGSGKQRLITRDADKDLGIFRNHKKHKTEIKMQDLTPEMQDFVCNDQVITFMKSGTRSLVHRPAYPDYIIIKKFDKEGNVTGGVRFMGLFTSIVYVETPNNIPLIRQKLDRVRAMANLVPHSHGSKELEHILEVYPREELFQSTAEQLHKTASNILNIQERRQTRIYLREDSLGKFLSVMAYIPRDIYNTELRHKMEEVLRVEYSPLDIEFNTFFSESILARTQFILRLDGNQHKSVDQQTVVRKLKQVVRSWSDDLHEALIEQVGEEQGNEQYHHYRSAFPAGYRDDFSARTAVGDIQHMEALRQMQSGELAMSFYRELEEGANELRFKLFNADNILPLSDVIPILENFGLRVMGEHPYEITCDDGRRIWIHNFMLRYTVADKIDIAAVKHLFQDSFKAIWHAKSENDGFNRLVLGAQLGWKDVSLLRGYARYMKQIRFGISETYIADTLCQYIPISAKIVEFFHARFNLDSVSEEQRLQRCDQLEKHIVESLDTVSQLNEDRTIRRYVELIKATLRTNFFQANDAGEVKSYISFKLLPSAISDMPLPRPMFEIFVYSPQIEGVHLRGGKVARGGLRWSDRTEDFRTEVLGLVKAQQVKNAVIVPVGAKGGFVAKCLPKDGGRDAFMAEGVRCYQTFISALLDVTDNLVEGELVPPTSVVRHDEDDPYLVVAADKGTATFSDIANEIAVNRGFWMGDGFASGGSIGYDHKKMGITARGAWVSVQRHFRELGINVQETDFSVVGVGDMGGDVFGNGMLLSQHICLVAAFNHMHIFIDPNPDSASSFKERQRLFEMPRSSWDDYNRELMSQGGGIFLRSAKSINITPEMKKRFDLTADKMAPTDLINAILKAPIDLIWNGGIGTYIKSKHELNSAVGDKANDALRVNGEEVRARVVGEGGNLGLTQLGRIEYGLAGGASYTDFIDNAGGVDCSDHEVNIKIMLNEVMDSGDLTRKQRNELFVQQTDEVGRLVLKNNYNQTQAIALAYRDCQARLDEYIRLMRDYESQGKLNRALEFLPSEEELHDRKAANLGLTRPELAVLISYTKADLKEQLNDACIVEDEYISDIVFTAFPSALVKQFPQQLRGHRLYKEIIATQLANDMVNFMGITFVIRMKDSTGCSIADIARAYVTARDTFKLPHYWSMINDLDYKIDTSIQEDMMAEIMRLVRRSTRWFARNRRGPTDIGAVVHQFQTAVNHIVTNLPATLKGAALTRWQQLYDNRIAAGVPKELAAFSAGAGELYAALGIIEASQESGCNVERVTEAYFGVGEYLSLSWFLQQVNQLPAHSHWEALARESFRDDLDWQQRNLTVGILEASDGTLSEAIDVWEHDQSLLVHRWQEMLEELKSTDAMEFAMIAVALRELLDLAQASHHA